MNESDVIILMYCSTIPNTTDYHKFEIVTSSLTDYQVAYGIGIENITFKVLDIPRDEYYRMMDEFTKCEQIQNGLARKTEINRLIANYRELYPVDEEAGELCPVLNRNLQRIEYGKHLVIQSKNNATIFKFVNATTPV